MLKVLINLYNAKAGNSLLKHLPEEEAEMVSNQDIRSSDIMPILFRPQQLIQKLHYSWLQPLVEKFPSSLHATVIAALTPEQITGLRKSLGVLPAKIPQPTKTFILNRLFALMGKHDHLPVEYLPQTELSSLVEWSKNELTDLIDFLSLHDLSSEVKQIVDKNSLKNLYSCLNAKEMYYLKVCLHQKEQVKPPKLEIDIRKQDCKHLRQILHRRGLIRLGKALAGQHPDLVWYIAHTLDTGRGKILLQYYAKEANPKITPILKLQVTNLMNFLKKE